MTTKDFRAAVVAEITTWAAASFPALPLFFENGPVPDEDAIGPIWLDVEIRWYSATPMTVGEGGSGRNSGAISVNVFYRQAEGTGLADDILDSLKATLKLRRVGGGIVRFPQRTVPTYLRSWYKTGLLFPFTLDE